MRNNKKLSIIVTVYNLEKYISDCLNSIINQNVDFDDIEVILIDDGSVDSSSIICKKYAERYEFIKYCYQKNQGVSSARNNGLNKSNGEYIYIIDGDDILLDDSLKIILEKLDYKYDLIQFDFIKFLDKNKLKLKTSKKRKKKTNEINKCLYPENINNIFSNNIFNLSLAVNVIKKSIIGDEKLNLNLKYTEDMDFLLTNLLKSKKIYYIPNALYGYRKSRNESATSTINIKRINDGIFFISKWKKYCEDTNNVYNKYLMSFLAYQYLILMGMSNHLKNKKIDDFLYSWNYLLNYHSFTKVKIGFICYKIFGYKITSKFMNWYLCTK